MNKSEVISIAIGDYLNIDQFESILCRKNKQRSRHASEPYIRGYLHDRLADSYD